MGGKKREKGSSLFYFLSLSLSLLEMSALTPPTVENMKKQAMAVLEEMLIDRGYHLTYVDRDLTQSESYYIKATHTDDQQWMLVFLNDEEKVNIASIKDRIVVMNREAASRCILVYRSSVTSTAKKSIDTLDCKIELFGLHELQLNITRHRLVPRHVRVTADEKKMLDDAFKGKLPQLLTSDAVSRYFSFSRGEYIRIHRKDGSKMYRVVK